MPTPEQIQQAIQQVKNQRSFIQVLLRDTLGWKMPKEVTEVEDIAYAWSADDLRASGLDEKIAEGQVWQIQPLNPNVAQSWGIFVLEFKHKDAFMTGRGLTGPLRSVLRGLVPKRRGGQANLRTWERENLLFVCTHKYRHFRFAYFKAPKDKEKTAPLAQFGWNEGDSDIRTLCKHNLLHLDWNPDDAEMGHWREAFSIEKVTKDFYREYAKVFEAVERAIEENNEISGDDLRLFTQTLFNRLMFLRFIEKKDWLRLNGDTSYLGALYAAGGIKKKSFYRSRLQPLFFEALAVEGKQTSDAVGEVVFLNGGLFEKTKLDDKVADIPDGAFEDILGREGLFYRFNFTVQESTPLDIEVAVDPEMLGKVFEELVTGRHESGSYYTPRPVVAFMCREAIKGFLSAKTSASPEAIARLVDEHEVAQDLTDKHAEEILFYLETVKAVDPACGSGAYLLGLLQELINVRRTLQNPKLTADPGFLFGLKLRLISQCLYGVDIDPFATNIAKLRLWLSLAVEAQSAQPLPNLDFKIETGDSVLGPCDAFAQSADALVMSALRTRALKLVSEKDEYMTAHGDKKGELYGKIRDEEATIAEETSTALGDGVIAWHVHFAEVFATGRRQRSLERGAFDSETFKVIVCEPGGFDIVLANPPYIRQELITDIKSRLKEVFPQTYMGTADLYTYFYTRAIEMLGPDGMLVFISSNKWFRANYGKKLREYVGKNCRVHSITDFKDSPIFKAAMAYPMICVAQKSMKKVTTRYTEVYIPSSEGLNVATLIKSQGRVLCTDALAGPEWSFADGKSVEDINKMRAAGIPLGEYAGKIFFGLKTSLNKAFVIDANTRDMLIAEDRHSEELIKPVVEGKHISRWAIHERQWLIVTPIGVDIDKYPAIFRYLSKWKSELMARYDQGNHWWEYRACSYYSVFEGNQIMWGNLGLKPPFTYVTGPLHALAPANTIPTSDLYLLGVMNSSPAHLFFSETAIQRSGGYYEYKPVYVKALPIPRASKQDKRPIESLVQKCLDARGENCEQWEREIDERVAKLYGIDVL